MQDFYNRFSSFNNEKLLSIVLDPMNYQPDAIEVARVLLKERGLQNELDAMLSQQAADNEVQEQRQFDEVVEKTKYYKDLVEWRETGVSFNIRVFDIPRFESELANQEIAFHREDKHVGAQLDTYPTHTYYFGQEDAETVDQMVKSLELITVPYTDIKPFFKFEFVVAIILFVIFIICIVLGGIMF